MTKPVTDIPPSTRSWKLPKVGVGLIDQVLSSASNTLIVFAIARVSGVESFGAISLALAALLATLAICRGALGVPISLLSDNPRELRVQTSHSFVAAGSMGLAASFLILPLGYNAGGLTMALALGLAAPLVLMQDVGRFYAAAASRPWVAVTSDGAWALSTLFLLGSTFLARPPLGARGIISGWVLTAAVASMLIMGFGGIHPRFRGIRGWFKGSSFHRRRFGMEAGVAAVGGFVVIMIVQFSLGSDAIAALRGAGTVLGPIAVLVSAIQLSVVPELRRLDLAVDALWSRLWRIALPMSLMSLTVGVLASLAPASWGEIVLGDTWLVVEGVIPITGAEYAALCWYAAVGAGLSARAQSGDLVRLRIMLVLLSATAAVVGAMVFSSVRAVSAGLVVSAVLVAAAGYRVLLRERVGE